MQLLLIVTPIVWWWTHVGLTNKRAKHCPLTLKVNWVRPIKIWIGPVNLMKSIKILPHEARFRHFREVRLIPDFWFWIYHINDDEFDLRSSVYVPIEILCNSPRRPGHEDPSLTPLSPEALHQAVCQLVSHHTDVDALMNEVLFYGTM